MKRRLKEEVLKLMDGDLKRNEDFTYLTLNEIESAGFDKEFKNFISYRVKKFMVKQKELEAIEDRPKKQAFKKYVRDFLPFIKIVIEEALLSYKVEKGKKRVLDKIEG